MAADGDPAGGAEICVKAWAQVECEAAQHSSTLLSDALLCKERALVAQALIMLSAIVSSFGGALHTHLPAWRRPLE